MRRGIWTTAAVAAIAIGLAHAQPAQNTNPNSGVPGALPRMRNPQGGMGDNSDASSRMGFVSGRVVLSDTEAPGAGVTVQRVCGFSVVAESQTDSAGRFSISLERQKAALGDASSGNAAVWGCELRASLSGYQTAVVPQLSRRATDDNGAVLVLRRAGERESFTVSVTTLEAPKRARKAYEKGLADLRHYNPDAAQAEFSRAVRLFPRFAAAWTELGNVYLQRDHFEEAREAYGKALRADASYLAPYEPLYRLDVRDSKWAEAAEDSGKLLRLDPYEFPGAFYLNALANLKLDRLDAAERSAQEAAKLTGAEAEPRGNYLLGVIRWRRGDAKGAIEKLAAFLKGAPEEPELGEARRLLLQIRRNERMPGT